MVDHSRIREAVSWSAIDVLVRHGFNFVVLIALARTLSPTDFGLVAMLAIFVAVSGLMIDSGFSQALIQRQQTTLTDESSIFYFSLMMGALIAVALCAMAPWIAAFYGQPLLEQMTYWMALNLFLNTFGTIHTALLTKELDFKTITKAGAVATLLSGVVAIYMAMHGWGVWSLVAQVLVMTTTTVIMLWLLHSWRPKLVFSVTSLQSFFKFGGFLLWTGLLNELHKNLYALLIGKMHSVQDVGFFSQAHRLQQLPVSILTNVVGRVAFPIFASVAADKEKLARGMRRGLTSIMFLNIPIMLGMMMLAEPLVLTLFGDKWLPSVPVLQALAVGGLIWPLHALNVNVLKAQGHSALNARIQFIKLSIALTILFLTSPFGILAIAYGQVVSSLLAFFVNAHYSRIFLNYGGLAQFRDILPYLAASLPMVLSIWLAGWIPGLPAQLELLAAVLIGSATYLMVCKLAKLEALESLIAMARKS